MFAGYTGVQPRLEQLKGTPDHTQRAVRACDPEWEKTHCRLIPAYAGLTASANMQQSPRAGVPALDLSTVSARKGHAGRDPCLLAGQCSSRADMEGVQSGLIGCQADPQGSPEASIHTHSSPAQPMSSNGASTQHAFTARAAPSGAVLEGPAQASIRPLSARGISQPCTTGHYHSSRPATCRGTYRPPLTLGTR